MNLSKEDIKAWVDTPPHSREWLAEMCGGVSPRTVNNWLTSNIEIPAKALRIIENLMRADADKIASTRPTLQNLVLRVEVEEFEDWNRAANANGQIVSDYCLSAIRAAYEAETLAHQGNGTHA